MFNFCKELPELDDMSLQDLSYKTVILKALSTVHRAQTIASIKISNTHKSVKGLEIKISDLIKTSGPGRFQPLLVLPKFKDDPTCVWHRWLRYIWK